MMKLTLLRSFVAGLLLTGSLLFAAERAPLREYDVLRSFPPGRLAGLHAGDKPDANGFTGGNRANGFWVEVGPQRGSCRGVIAAVVLDDLAASRPPSLTSGQMAGLMRSSNPTGKLPAKAPRPSRRLTFFCRSWAGPFS